METTTVNIDDHISIDRVVDITHVEAQDRFPDLPVRLAPSILLVRLRMTQVSGFALTRAGQIRYVRWVPGKYQYVNTWDPATETLGYHVPDRAQPFVVRSLQDCQAQAAAAAGRAGLTAPPRSR